MGWTTGRPKLLGLVVRAIARWSDIKGTTAKKITDMVKRCPELPVKGAKVVPLEVKRALEHGMGAGMLKKRAGGRFVLTKAGFRVASHFRPKTLRRRRGRGRKGGGRKKGGRRRRRRRRASSAADSVGGDGPTDRENSLGSPSPTDVSSFTASPAPSDLEDFSSESLKDRARRRRRKRKAPRRKRRRAAEFVAKTSRYRLWGNSRKRNASASRLTTAQRDGSAKGLQDSSQHNKTESNEDLQLTN